MSILIREEKTRVWDIAVVRTLSRVKVRLIGEGVEKSTLVYAASGKDDTPEKNGLVGTTETAYSGTPYVTVTKRYEK